MNWEKKIFLAHASEDKEVVRRYYEDFLDHGLFPWFDEVDLIPGCNWDEKIKEAIEKSRIFMPFISTNSINKDGYVQRELRTALSYMEQKPPETTYVLPVLIDSIDIPNVTVGTINLKEYHAVRLYGPHYKIEYKKLTNALIKYTKSGFDIQLARKINEKIKDREWGQACLFPVTKSELEREFTPATLEGIKEFLSFDLSEKENVHFYQEDEIRFFAAIHNLSNEAKRSSLLDVLLSKIPTDKEISFSRDIFFDLFSLKWKNLSEITERAIENHIQEMDLSELTDYFEDKLAEELQGCEKEYVESYRRSVLSSLEPAHNLH